MRGEESGYQFSVMFPGTANSIAIMSGESGRKYFVTDIAGSTDIGGGRVEIRDGTTIVYQNSIPSGGGTASAYVHSFARPISGTTGNSISLYVGTAASVSYANISGYYIQ